MRAPRFFRGARHAGDRRARGDGVLLRRVVQHEHADPRVPRDVFRDFRGDELPRDEEHDGQRHGVHAVGGCLRGVHRGFRGREPRSHESVSGRGRGPGGDLPERHREGKGMDHSVVARAHVSRSHGPTRYRASARALRGLRPQLQPLPHARAARGVGALGAISISPFHE